VLVWSSNCFAAWFSLCKLQLLDVLCSITQYKVVFLYKTASILEWHKINWSFLFSHYLSSWGNLNLLVIYQRRWKKTCLCCLCLFWFYSIDDHCCKSSSLCISTLKLSKSSKVYNKVVGYTYIHNKQSNFCLCLFF
jgi:hypothetical protein